MIKFTLFLFVCTTISTGYQQEINSLFPPNVGNDNTNPQIWSYQGYQGQRRSKPCFKRRNKNGAEEQWIPSYSSIITQPRYDTTILQPQALKNDEVTESKHEPETTDDQQNLPERRSFDLVHLQPVTHLNEDDCTDYLESGIEKPFNTGTPEEAVIKLIQDCLKRKENANNQPEPVLGSSRRSMTDLNDSDYLDRSKNNNYPKVSDESVLLDDDVGNNNNLQNADVSRDATPNNLEDKSGNPLTSKLMDPVRGTGIAVEQSNNIFLKDPRICYACSTATNPSCWEPDRRTTIKYCPKEQSCVTKSFGVKNSLTVIRDCANSCDDSSVYGIAPQFKSCKLCHSDYCNGAISINSYNLLIILVISIVKCFYS